MSSTGTIDQDSEVGLGPTELMPAAFLGYKWSDKYGYMVRICGWCPSKSRVEVWARNRGSVVTHGICPECATRNFGKLLGEQTNG